MYGNTVHRVSKSQTWLSYWNEPNWLMETKNTPNIQSNLVKEIQSWGMRFHDFKLYCKARVIKTEFYWHKNKNIDKWQDRSSEISPHTYEHLMYDKRGMNIQWKETVSSVMVLEKLVYYIIHKNKIKMDKRPICNTEHYTIARRIHRRNTLWHKQDFWSTSYLNEKKKTKANRS